MLNSSVSDNRKINKKHQGQNDAGFYVALKQYRFYIKEAITS